MKKTRKSSKSFIRFFAIPALLIGLSGCSAAATEEPAAQKNSGSAALTSEEWSLAYAKCMREHGIDVPDPSGDGSVQSFSMDMSSAYTEASDACMKELGSPPAPTAAEIAEADAAVQKAGLKIAECYRASGIDVPDPKPGEALMVPQDAPAAVVEECGGGGQNMTVVR